MGLKQSVLNINRRTGMFGSYCLEIHKKKIKHIYFRIYPSRKAIVVSAPIHIDEKTLSSAIESKQEWIERQIIKADSQPKESAFSFMKKENCWLWGKKYHLIADYQSGRHHVWLHDENTIKLLLRPSDDKNIEQAMILSWLRAELKEQIYVLIEKWEPIIGVHIEEGRVKKMKTRWGSCNIQAKRIWLNLVLVHLSPCFLEYVVVHEMVHLLERKHNARFKNFMDQFIPDWPNLKAQLDQINL